MPKKSTTGAAAWARRANRTHLWVTVTPEEQQQIRVAAAHAGLPMSQFVAQAALEAAKKVLDRKS